MSVNRNIPANQKQTNNTSCFVRQPNLWTRAFFALILHQPKDLVTSQLVWIPHQAHIQILLGQRVKYLERLVVVERRNFKRLHEQSASYTPNVEHDLCGEHDTYVAV